MPDEWWTYAMWHSVGQRPVVTDTVLNDIYHISYMPSLWAELQVLTLQQGQCRILVQMWAPQNDLDGAEFAFMGTDVTIACLITMDAPPGATFHVRANLPLMQTLRHQ